MPAVVDGDVAEQLDLAGLGVDLDDGDVGPEGERRVALVEVELGGEADGAVVVVDHAVGHLGLRRGGQLGPRQRPSRAPRPRRDRPSSVRRRRPRDGLEQVGGERAGLVEHGLGRAADRRAADLQRAGPAGPAAAAAPGRCRTGRAGCPRPGCRVGRTRSWRTSVAWPWPWADVPAPDRGRAVGVRPRPRRTPAPAAGGDLDVGGARRCRGAWRSPRSRRAACSARSSS